MNSGREAQDEPDLLKSLPVGSPGPALARLPALTGRFWRLPRVRKRLLLEAWLLIGLSSAAVRWLPFRHIVRLASSPERRTRFDGDLASLLEDVRWAVLAAARRSPWRAVCFQQGLAAHLMLRRRGIGSTLNYGAAKVPGGGLSAHVWITWGDVPVLGCETANHYALLATYPPSAG